MICCPTCGSDHFRVSRRGWLRPIARWVLLRPLRCLDCYARFWRFCLTPPGARRVAGH